MSVAKKYDILLFGSKKKGRTSKADIEKAALIAQTSAEIQAASQALLRGTDEYGITDAQVESDISNSTIIKSGIAYVSSDFDANLDSSPHQETILSNPFGVSSDPKVTSTTVAHVLSKVAAPRGGGTFSRALGNSLQKFKCLLH